MLNLTPHNVVVKDIDGRCLTIPPSGQVARIVTETNMVGIAPLTGVTVPVFHRTVEKITGLPFEDEPCIVSDAVFEAVRVQQPWRRNVYAPYAGPTAIRDEDGNVVAVRRLMRVQP